MTQAWARVHARVCAHACVHDGVISKSSAAWASRDADLPLGNGLFFVLNKPTVPKKALGTSGSSAPATSTDHRPWP